jgi:hypothetical protein
MNARLPTTHNNDSISLRQKWYPCVAPSHVVNKEQAENISFLADLAALRVCKTVERLGCDNAVMRIGSLKSYRVILTLL